MKLYVLQNPKVGRTDAVTDFMPVEGSRMGDAPQCGVCGKYLGLRPLLPPIRVELEAWGSRWGDVAFGTGDEILISHKLSTLFAESALVGFERIDPVEVMNFRRRRPVVGDPPQYFLAAIMRSRARLDELASGLVRDELPTCEECRVGGIVKRVERIVLDANTWSGEDLFFARGLPGTILASERFKRLCDDNDLSNCRLVPAQEFSFDDYPHEGSAPHK
jgi:hypothetical protein